MFLLEVEHLACSLRPGRSMFGGEQARPVLRDVTFSLEKGENFGLLGPSGSGKSTIARCIAGLQEPDRGMIRFAGKTLWPQRRRRVPDPRIQLLFQATSLSLDPKMKILPAIEEGFTPCAEPLTADQRRQRIDELLDAVDLRPSILDRYPHELSGGQRQRAALMRSLASGAPLLILDEPTAALDPITASSVLSLIETLRRRLDLTLIYITHDRETARAFCSRIGVVNDGVLRLSKS